MINIRENEIPLLFSEKFVNEYIESESALELFNLYDIALRIGTHKIGELRMTVQDFEAIFDRDNELFRTGEINEISYREMSFTNMWSLLNAVGKLEQNNPKDKKVFAKAKKLIDLVLSKLGNNSSKSSNNGKTKIPASYVSNCLDYYGVFALPVNTQIDHIKTNLNKAVVARDIKDGQIENLGIVLSTSQQRVMESIQNILQKRNYQTEDGTIQFTPKELVECAGHDSTQGGKGWNDTINTFKQLAETKFGIVRKFENKGIAEIEYSALFSVIEGCEYQDMGGVMKIGRTQYFKIRPHPMMLEFKNYLLFPTDFRRTLNKATAGKKVGDEIHAFCLYLMNQVLLSKSSTPHKLHFNYLKIAQIIRMTSELKAKRYSRIKDKLTKFCQTLQDMEYIFSFKWDSDNIYFELNPDKFSKAKSKKNGHKKGKNTTKTQEKEE